LHDTNKNVVEYQTLPFTVFYAASCRCNDVIGDKLLIWCASSVSRSWTQRATTL